MLGYLKELSVANGYGLKEFIKENTCLSHYVSQEKNMPLYSKF